MEDSSYALFVHLPPKYVTVDGTRVKFGVSDWIILHYPSLLLAVSREQGFDDVRPFGLIETHLLDTNELRRIPSLHMRPISSLKVACSVHVHVLMGSSRHHCYFLIALQHYEFFPLIGGVNYL